jgi:SmpA / OmlA family
MTNDEFPMTNEIRMTNDEKSKGVFRGISSFVLRPALAKLRLARHSFDIRQPRRSLAEAGHLSFVIFTRVVLTLAVTVAFSCSGKRITKANVDQVSEGMSKKQVESILGPPTSLNTQDLVITKKTTYVYRQGKDTVTIVFKDDKVQSKDSTLSD